MLLIEVWRRNYLFWVVILADQDKNNCWWYLPLKAASQYSLCQYWKSTVHTRITYSVDILHTDIL